MVARWSHGDLKEGPPEFKFSALSRSAESPLNLCIDQNNKKNMESTAVLVHDVCS